MRSRDQSHLYTCGAHIPPRRSGAVFAKERKFCGGTLNFIITIMAAVVIGFAVGGGL